MNNKSIYTKQVSLIGLFDELKVESIVIPIIQRDYAQGRNEEHEIRSHFLQSLKLYLEDPNKESHDLDFVYGNLNKDNEFIPIDGQQRLTTLFLLHYYLSIHDDKFEDFQSIFVKNGYSRFIYQTRLSSTDFCNALVKNPVEINQPKISDNIRYKYPWFSESWIYDPTIVSMLTMLDSIHSLFNKSEGLYQRLMDLKLPSITFQILFMEESGLTDDLYIKMNSRGLELTPFENLKAHIIKGLKESTKKYQLIRTDSKGEETVSQKDYFAYKIDISWAALFWVYRRKMTRKKEDGTTYEIFDTDSIMLNFINTILLNYKALDPTFGISNEQLSKYDKLTWADYENIGEDFYTVLIDILDLFENKANLMEGGGICNRLPEKSKFQVRTTFEDFIYKKHNDAAYDEHIRLYAYYSYLITHEENFNQTDFEQWMRIVMNLTTNHSWQNIDDFRRSMSTIQWLNNHNSNGILQLLSSGETIQEVGFNPVQFKEERIKACLLLREDASDWANYIYCAEDIPYLKGQTISILNFSEIESYFDEHKRCDWSVAENKNYLNLFHRYTHLYSYVFNADGVKSELIGDDELFRRALLCKGDYLMGISSDRWSMVINSHRDYSWHRYLQDSNENRRIFFKELLDGFNENEQRISENEQRFKEYLEDVIRNYKSDDSNDWKYLLIKEKDVWKYFGPNKLLRFANNEKDVYILSATTMGGWHAELRTYYLFCQISNECHLKKYVRYEYSQSWEAPCIYIQHEKEFCIGIQFLDNEWRMWIEINEENYKFTTEEESKFKMMKFEIEDDPYCYAHYESTIDIPYIQTLVDELLSIRKN